LHLKSAGSSLAAVDDVNRRQQFPAAVHDPIIAILLPLLLLLLSSLSSSSQSARSFPVGGTRIFALAERL
jgi:hypothetical protein